MLSLRSCLQVASVLCFQLMVFRVFCVSDNLEVLKLQPPNQTLDSEVLALGTAGSYKEALMSCAQ
jgi:hypothetical protein